MLNDKERKTLLSIRDKIISDDTDAGDALLRVHRRIITEMLGLDYTKEILLMEKPPFKPMYFPENYETQHEKE